MPVRNATIDSVRRRRSGQETRAEILAAAERHFAERGFEAALLEDIAADVGIRRAAIFYYFGDKQELYDAVLAQVFRDAMQDVLPDKGSAAERIEASLTGWIDFVARRPSVARLILREVANAQPDTVSPFMRAGVAPLEWFRSVIEEGVASGEVKPLTDPYRLISLMGATTVFHFAAMPWRTLGVSFDASSKAELAKHKREIVLQARHMLGIGSRPSRRRT